MRAAELRYSSPGVVGAAAKADVECYEAAVEALCECDVLGVVGLCPTELACDAPGGSYEVVGPALEDSDVAGGEAFDAWSASWRLMSPR
jgi:hypothetical protein